MYSLQICQFVVVRVDACAEEQSGVSSIYNLGHVPEFDEVGLVFLVAGRNQTVDLADLIAIRNVVCEVLSTRLCKPPERTGDAERGG